jgi:hypothetical protein
MTGGRDGRDAGDDDSGKVDQDGAELDKLAEPATGLRTAQEGVASKGSSGASGGGEAGAATDGSSATGDSDIDGLDELMEPSTGLRTAQEQETETSTGDGDGEAGRAGDRDA